MNYNYNRLPYHNDIFFANETKKHYLHEIKKKSNGLGFFVFAYFVLMQMSAVVIVVLLTLFGLSENDLGSTSIPMFLLEIFISVFGAFIPCLFYFLISNTKIWDTISVKSVKLSLLVPIVCLGLAGAMFANYVSDIVAHNFSFFQLENTVNFSSPVDSPIKICLYIISTAVTPALAEEFAFRGVIMGTLRKYGDAFAIIASSVMFGAMHGNISQIPFAFILGLIFAYVDCITDSLLPSIIIHFLNNLYAVVIDILQNSGMDTDIFYGIYLLIILLFCITGIISFILLYNKKNDFFKISNNDGVTAFDTNTVNISLKEKCKCFFTEIGTVLCLSIFLIETVFSLGILDV